MRLLLLLLDCLLVPVSVDVSVDLSVDLGMVDHKDVNVRVIIIISMMVLCNDIVIIEHNDGRRPGLSNAPLDMEYDNNRTEQ